MVWVMKRLAVVAILFLAFCGLADSAYITQQEMAGAPLLCNVESLSGCNIVAQSPYAYVFGISLSEYGMLFYGIIFIVAAVELALRRSVLRRSLQLLALLGVVLSLYFTFVQVFVIQALCMYCLASAFISVLLLILAAYIEPLRSFRLEAEHLGEAPPPPRPPFTMPPAS